MAPRRGGGAGSRALDRGTARDAGRAGRGRGCPSGDGGVVGHRRRGPPDRHEDPREYPADASARPAGFYYPRRRPLPLERPGHDEGAFGGRGKRRDDDGVPGGSQSQVEQRHDRRAPVVRAVQAAGGAGPAGGGGRGRGGPAGHRGGVRPRGRRPREPEPGVTVVSGKGQGETKPLILVVDDDTAIRDLVREALEHFQFAVVEARNGAEGVQQFARHKPELVVMDVRMPEMTGFEACALMRKTPGGANTPILILTGLDDTDSIKSAYEAGATDFASKPVNLFVLGHRLRYMLRAKRTVDELRDSEARLASAQRIARLGNWERDLKSGRMRWSAETYRIYGVDPKTFTPGLASYLERVHPEDRDIVARATGEEVRREGPYSFDARILMPDGAVRFVHEQAEAIFDDDGTPVRLAGTTQDITERKQIEDQ